MVFRLSMKTEVHQPLKMEQVGHMNGSLNQKNAPWSSKTLIRQGKYSLRYWSLSNLLCHVYVPESWILLLSWPTDAVWRLWTFLRHSSGYQTPETVHPKRQFGNKIRQSMGTLHCGGKQQVLTHNYCCICHKIYCCICHKILIKHCLNQTGSKRFPSGGCTLASGAATTMQEHTHNKMVLNKHMLLCVMQYPKYSVYACRCAYLLSNGCTRLCWLQDFIHTYFVT